MTPRVLHGPALFACGHSVRQSANPGPSCNICERKAREKALAKENRAQRLASRPFNCGHERTAANTIRNGKRQKECRICCNARARKHKTAFRCGHPVEGNVTWFGRIRRCAICTKNADVGRQTVQLYKHEFAPRYLPVTDTSERSYALFPKKYA